MALQEETYWRKALGEREQVGDALRFLLGTQEKGQG